MRRLHNVIMLGGTGYVAGLVTNVGFSWFVVALWYVALAFVALNSFLKEDF